MRVKCKFRIGILICLLVCIVFSFGMIRNNIALAEESDSVFDSNPSWGQYNNCYAYAIDRWIPDYSTQVSNSIYCHPSSFSSNQYMSGCDVEDLADWTVDDLIALGCINVTKTTTCPNLNTIAASGSSLVCVRTGIVDGVWDYHFMRYNIEDGYWYHKPGESAILRYKYNPEEKDEWVGEFYNKVTGTIERLDGGYDSEIYYISYYTCYNAATDSHEIKSYQDLQFMQNITDGSFILKSDINIPSNQVWNPVSSFNGVFDGQGHTISGLEYQGGANTNIGFVQILQQNGQIINTVFSNVVINVTGNINLSDFINIGSIAGINKGIIYNCQVGTTRIYGEATITSNTIANTGGICGINDSAGEIQGCAVNYFNAAICGYLGGIAGTNYGFIGDDEDCTVNNSNLSLYWGAVGGLVGYNYSLLTNSSITLSEISCYNGYPDDLSEYYSSSHYGLAGGVVGCSNSSSSMSNCSVSYVDVVCNAEYVDADNGGRSFAPEMGSLCGRRISGASIQSNSVSNVEIYKGELHTEEWWSFIIKKTWNQAQYVGGEIGRTV